MFLFLQALAGPYDVPLETAEEPKEEVEVVANAPATPPTFTASAVQKNVRDFSNVEEQIRARLLALEHYLADQQAVREGRAPKGWVLPAYEEYAKPGAPASFLP